jgi:hypothetical protein
MKVEKSWGKIRIRIGVKIESQIWIWIGNKTVPIHSTVFIQKRI